MTSLQKAVSFLQWRHLYTLNTATLWLKSSRYEQRAVIPFFCEQKDLMQIRFTQRCIQYMATRYYEANSKGLCKKMLDWQKFASATEVQ